MNEVSGQVFQMTENGLIQYQPTYSTLSNVFKLLLQPLPTGKIYQYRSPLVAAQANAKSTPEVVQLRVLFSTTKQLF